MKNAIKKISIFVLLFSVIFAFNSCGGSQLLLPEKGQIPDETVFEEQLGVLPEEAEELMVEVDKIQEGFRQFNPFNDNDSRGTMLFGPYPYFRKYNLEVIRLQFEQIFVFDNIQGSLLVNYYVSDEYLGHDVQENDMLDHSEFLASLNVEASGEQKLIFDSNVSAGAKEILKKINESIQENKKVEVYVYAITTYNHLDDQVTVVEQSPTLTLTVDLNLETPNENPTINKISGSDGEINNVQSEFSWDGNDPDGNINEYIVSKDGVTKRTKNKSVVWVGYSEGQHIFKVKGIDNRGGISNELIWTFTYLSGQEPTVQKVSGPEAEIRENNTTFEWTGSDNVGSKAIVKYQYKKGTGVWTDMSPLTGTKYTWSSITEGSHSFSVRAVDGEDAISNVISWNFSFSQATQDIVYRALLIGIENYGGDNDLDYTYDDVIDIQTIMNNQSYNYQIEKLGGSQQVTKEQILSKLNEYANDPSIDSDDVFFFGYSGHGAYVNGTSYLVSSDLYGLSVAEIRSKLDNIPGTKIVSIDACQSGAFVNISGMRMDNKMNQRLAREYFIQDIIDNFSTEKGTRGAFETEHEYYAMAASAIDEYSWESSGIENGFYTFFLVDGVGHNGLANPLGAFNSTYNADANGNHSITLSELYNYISTNVYNLTVSYELQTVQVYPTNSQYVLFEY